MIVYHGSDSNFKQLKISKSLTKRSSTLDNEGVGIYFTTDIDTARGYGKYLYTLEINDFNFRDFRNIKVCSQFMYDLVNTLIKVFNVNIGRYIDINSYITRVHVGGISIYNIGKDIAFNLDNNAEFYTSYNKTQREKVYRFLKKYCSTQLKSYMFTYHIPNIGVIKVIEHDVVRIVNKEFSY